MICRDTAALAGLFPENTLSGFLGALSLGVDAVELDMAVTADRVPVVFHDAVLHGDIARGPGSLWLECDGPPIRALTAAGLARYDVGRLRPGSRYAAAHPLQVPYDGVRIPPWPTHSPRPPGFLAACGSTLNSRRCRIVRS